MELTMDRPEVLRHAMALRAAYPELLEPRILPHLEQPMLALDGDRPWLIGPVDHDPQRTARGHSYLPRRQIQALRTLAADTCRPAGA